MIQTQYIAIEGNIGAGKSTLAKLLAPHYNAPAILEQFADNPFLSMFYTNPERYALPVELTFLADRYRQLTSSLAQHASQPIVIADYIFPKSELFAGINLTGAEYDLFRSYFNIININIPDPDVLIFLDAPIGVLLQNIKTRGRSYEQDIQGAYLEKVQRIYHSYIKTAGIKTILVDRTAVDFIQNPEYVYRLTTFIRECPGNDIYRFKL